MHYTKRQQKQTYLTYKTLHNNVMPTHKHNGQKSMIENQHYLIQYVTNTKLYATLETFYLAY
jgi:hypothetical protein